MSEQIAIVGPSGSGKSTSLKTLDPKSTIIINVAGKKLPFKGSSSVYNGVNKNYIEADDALEILKYLQNISKSMLHIKKVIIDDFIYSMAFNLARKATEVGYTKFSLLGKNIVHLITESRKLREDLQIYFLTHSEVVNDGDSIVGYKIKTAGKMIDNQIVIEGLFTVVLYTSVDEGKEGKMEYTFVTNRNGIIPAKSPAGMFDEIRIPNDLKLVSEAITEYYK